MWTPSYIKRVKGYIAGDVMNSQQRVRDGIQVKIRVTTLERLRHLKTVLGMRSYSDVIDYLVNEYMRSRARASV